MRGLEMRLTRLSRMSVKMSIRGISHDIRKQGLFEYLIQSGKIVHFIIKSHPDTGITREFGFVLLKDSSTEGGGVKMVGVVGEPCSCLLP